MPAGLKSRGKKERAEIYDILQTIVDHKFTEEERDKVRASLLKYVKSEVLVFIAKSDKDKNDFLHSV